MAHTNQTATGNINVASFVVIDNAVNNGVKQATGTSTPIFGIAQEYADTAPIPGANAQYAATAGEGVMVYQVGDVCFLTVGSLGWSAGDLLTSLSDGSGTTATTGNWYGAQALAAGTAGATSQVKVVFGKA